MAPPQPPPKGGSRPGLGGRLALLTASVLAAWLALSSRVTRDGHDSRGSVPLPAALVPLQGSPDGAPPAASSEFTTRAARELLPRLQQSAAQARLHQRWEFGGATTGARQLRIPRILHHVYFPGVDAYLDRVSDISSDTRMRWGAACVHHHPGWEHVFWDLEAARQLIAEYYPSYLEMFVGMKGVINQANTIRYFIMHAIGGLYLDMDVECFRNGESFLLDADVILQGTPRGCTNGILASVPGHPLWEAAIQRVHKNWLDFTNKWAGSNQATLTGPGMLTATLTSFNLQQSPNPQVTGMWSGVHSIANSTVVVQPKGTWFVPCQYNDKECHKQLAMERAVGVANLAKLAGFHRYAASWTAGTNAAGVHSMKGLQAAMCTGNKLAQAAPCTPVPCLPQLQAGSSALASPAGGPVGGSGNGASSLPARKALLPIRHRTDIAMVLEQEQLRTGAELGVQAGVFSEQMLKVWKSCERYLLIDLWGKQENYDDVANVDAQEQERRYQETRRRLAPWASKTTFFRNYTVLAALEIEDGSLDFIYVDARHDYCGVKEDLMFYWPKLRSGGILAGHDYLTATEVKARNHPRTQDWSLCADGTIHDGAVKAAVDEFAAAHGLSVTVTYNEASFPSWMARKP